MAAVFWLSHPPYLRWILAAVLVIGAIAWEFRQAATVPYPFAGRTIAAGEPIPEDALVWRAVPRGLMEAPDLSEPIAGRTLAAGEPIGPSALAEETVIPDEWWSVPIVLPATALPGRHVRLVLLDGRTAVDGIVAAAARPDPLSLSDAGLVAVAAEHAPEVAAAAVAGTVAVLVRP